MQNGVDVAVAGSGSGSGSIDTAALTEISNNGANSTALFAARGAITVGTGSDSIWVGPTEPTSFGSGGLVFEGSETGQFTGIIGGGQTYLPANYVSKAAISGSAVFNNTTIAALGLTQGTYTYTWGSGATADSLVVQIGSSVAVPEPGTIALLLLPALGLLAFRTARRA